MHQHLHLAFAITVEQCPDAIQLVAARFARRRVEATGQSCVDADILLLALQPVLLDFELHGLQGHKTVHRAEISRIQAAPGKVIEQDLQSAFAIGRAGIEKAGLQQTAVLEPQFRQGFLRIVQLVLDDS